VRKSQTKKRSEIDKAAAGRFIKHAIAQAKQGRKAEGETTGEANLAGSSNNSQPSTFVPTRVTGKMRERERYEQKLREEEDEEEAVLDVIDDDGRDSDLQKEEEPVQGKGKGVTNAARTGASLGSQSASQSSKKRRKPTMDPFGEFGTEPDVAAAHADDREPSKKKSRTATMVAENESARSSRASSESILAVESEGSQPKKRKRKKGTPKHSKDAT